MKAALRCLPLILALGAGRAWGGQPSAPPPLPAAGMEARISLLPDDRFLQSFEQAVREAKKEVVICSYLFIAGEKRSKSPDRLAAALTEASSRGVKVKVYLEQDGEDRELTDRNRRTARLLSRGGVAVVFDDPKVKTHAKVAVIDRRLTFIGSHNLTDSALRFNREMSIRIESAEAAQAVLSYLDSIGRARR